MRNAMLEPYEEVETKQRSISTFTTKDEVRSSVHVQGKKEEKENISRIEKKLGVIERSWVMHESKRHRRRCIRDLNANKNAGQHDDKTQIEALERESSQKDDEIKRLAISNGKLHLEVMRLQQLSNKENLIDDSNLQQLKAKLEREKQALLEKEKHLNQQQIKLNNEYKKINFVEKSLDQTRKDLDYDKSIINQRREHLEEMQQKLNGTILQLL